MALDLVDLPTVKVDVQVHALLKAESMTQRCDMNALVREILHDWASKKYDTFTMAQEILKAKQLPGLDGEWK